MRIPTEQEWDGWNTYASTETLRQFAAHKIEDLKNRWANGEFTYPTDTATLLKNAEALGEIKAWSVIKELSYTDILTELEDEHIPSARPEGGS